MDKPPRDAVALGRGDGRGGLVILDQPCGPCAVRAVFLHGMKRLALRQVVLTQFSSDHELVPLRRHAPMTDGYPDVGNDEHKKPLADSHLEHIGHAPPVDSRMEERRVREAGEFVQAVVAGRLDSPAPARAMSWRR